HQVRRDALTAHSETGPMVVFTIMAERPDYVRFSPPAGDPLRGIDSGGQQSDQRGALMHMPREGRWRSGGRRTMPHRKDNTDPRLWRRCGLA
ncbi:MAG TPA: hypothetical protein VGK33_01005, partial [Chloroflexota bacterium]